MKKSIKKQWVKALRSGKYSRTKGTLKDGVGHCCLGVLCEVLSPSEDIEIGEDYISLDGDEDCLSVEVLGLTNLYVEEEAELSRMNDDLGLDFNQIADYIEKNL